MADLSAVIAKMLIEGEGIPNDSEPPEMVDCILDRWPDATAEEIERGFRIAIEMQRADDITEGWRADSNEKAGAVRVLDPNDAAWFASHPDDTHRIRRATSAEISRFAVRSLKHPKLLTIVRRADAAAVTYAFKEGDDIDRACDFELAGWFDGELDHAARMIR